MQRSTSTVFEVGEAAASETSARSKECEWPLTECECKWLLCCSEGMLRVRVVECMRASASGYCAVAGACVRVATECVRVRVAIVL